MKFFEFSDFFLFNIICQDIYAERKKEQDNSTKSRTKAIFKTIAKVEGCVNL